MKRVKKTFNPEDEAEQLMLYFRDVRNLQPPQAAETMALVICATCKPQNIEQFLAKLRQTYEVMHGELQ